MKQELDLKAIDDFSKTIIGSLNFTMKSENIFYDTVDLKDFQDNDAETIFNCLKKELRLIPFGDYLKRYIFIKTGMTGSFDEIEIRDYQYTIIDSFTENYTPKSFVDTTAKISALAKNWLTQSTVSRSVVFLLGFGLNMNVDDVSGFLIKALRERDFNFKNPIEVIYWYCYKEGYKYPQMLKLKQQHEESDVIFDEDFESAGTIRIRKDIKDIRNDESLLRYLAGMKRKTQIKTQSKTVNNRFSELYSECKKIVADFYNADEQERGTQKVWTINDINEGDVEKVLCCGMPVNTSGNLEKLSASVLSKYFSNKRFSRQHIADLLSKTVPIDRFDIITLNFFIYSQDAKYENDNKNRFIAFTDSTNEILNDCMMGELYVANPYECFLLMCILSDCPLATYADVWEMSFEE